MVRRFAALIVTFVFVSSLTACQGETGVKPPLPYVERHQSFHVVYKTLIDRYTAEHPGAIAKDMNTMWKSEDAMIQNALMGNFPTTAP